MFIPLFGAHQAQNAAVALAAVEAFLGSALDDDVVREAFAEVTSPGRLEVVRRSPTIVLDAAHNPHGAEATAAALEDSFQFAPLIGVIGVMGDKDAEGLLAAFEPHLAHVVCTQNSTARAMPAAELARVAVEVFGEDRVSIEPRLDHAIEQAAALAEAGEAVELDGLGRRARHRLGRHRRRGPLAAGPERGHERPRPLARGARMCAAILALEGDRPRALDAGDDRHLRRQRRRGAPGRARPRPRRVLAAGMLRTERGYALG